MRFCGWGFKSIYKWVIVVGDTRREEGATKGGQGDQEAGELVGTAQSL